MADVAGFTYSRYADDAALSSPTHCRADQADRLVAMVSRIATDEGFRINTTKTVIRRAGPRQRLAGIVINDRLNVDRREYDRLKAILHNAARHGPTGQNRRDLPHFREHLLGRVAWVNQLNPRRGERLLATFAQISWPDGEE